jgi:hypothetical protein
MDHKFTFRGPDKQPITDESFYRDYDSAETIGKVKVGSRAVYYKDGRRYFCIPLEYIDRVFTRISGCNARMCCAGVNYDYYRLILVHGDKEISNIIFGHDMEEVDRAGEMIQARRPEIALGYVKPAKPPKKAKAIPQ